MTRTPILFAIIVSMSVSAFAMDGFQELNNVISDADKMQLTQTAPAAQKFNEVTAMIKEYAKSVIETPQAVPAAEPITPTNNEPAVAINIRNNSSDVIASKVEINEQNAQQPTKIDKKGWFSCQFLTKKQAIAFGVGAIALIAVGGVTYVLYKNGTLKKIGDQIIAHPYVSSAAVASALATIAACVMYPEQAKVAFLGILGVAAASGAAVGVYLKGNWKEQFSVNAAVA